MIRGIDGVWYYVVRIQIESSSDYTTSIPSSYFTVPLERAIGPGIVTVALIEGETNLLPENKDPTYHTVKILDASENINIRAPRNAGTHPANLSNRSTINGYGLSTLLSERDTGNNHKSPYTDMTMAAVILHETGHYWAANTQTVGDIMYDDIGIDLQYELINDAVNKSGNMPLKYSPCVVEKMKKSWEVRPQPLFPDCEHILHTGASCTEGECTCQPCPICKHAAHFSNDPNNCKTQACTCLPCPAWGCHHAPHAGRACGVNGCTCFTLTNGQ